MDYSKLVNEVQYCVLTGDICRSGCSCPNCDVPRNVSK